MGELPRNPGDVVGERKQAEGQGGIVIGKSQNMDISNGPTSYMSQCVSVNNKRKDCESRVRERVGADPVDASDDGKIVDKRLTEQELQNKHSTGPVPDRIGNSTESSQAREVRCRAEGAKSQNIDGIVEKWPTEQEFQDKHSTGRVPERIENSMESGQAREVRCRAEGAKSQNIDGIGGLEEKSCQSGDIIKKPERHPYEVSLQENYYQSGKSLDKMGEVMDSCICAANRVKCNMCQDGGKIKESGEHQTDTSDDMLNFPKRGVCQCEDTKSMIGVAQSQDMSIAKSCQSQNIIKCMEGCESQDCSFITEAKRDKYQSIDSRSSMAEESGHVREVVINGPLGCESEHNETENEGCQSGDTVDNMWVGGCQGGKVPLEGNGQKGVPPTRNLLQHDGVLHQVPAPDQEDAAAKAAAAAADKLIMNGPFKAGIRANRVTLVENLDTDRFHHLMDTHLTGQPYQGQNRQDKVRNLLDLLWRCPEYLNREFMQLISGNYPNMFFEVTGREPTKEESDCCVQNLSEQLRKTVIDKGHCTDVDTDKRIQFENQFVQLLMIKDREKMLPSTEQLPNDYQQNLRASNTTHEQLIPEDSHGLTVLVRGRAGIGKTTFSQWLMLQWALRIWAGGFTCGFMLNLRFLLQTEYRMSLCELLTLCSLYSPGGARPQLGMWMRNCQQRAIFFLDGIDELPELRNLLKKTRKIHNLTEEATSLEWCINILRRDILPDSTKLIFSRPFKGLTFLQCDRVFELLGLIRQKVIEFIHKHVPAEKCAHVERVLTRNSTLLSACAITFYASALCKVLQEESAEDDLDVQTYTQLTAFIMLKSAIRGFSPSDDPMDMAQVLKDFLPPFAGMALRGLQTGGQAARLVFDQRDITAADISQHQQEEMQRAGLLHVNEFSDQRGTRFYSEFQHLSIQEILAMAGLLQGDPKNIRKKAAKLFRTGRFNLAQFFLLGLAMDKTNEWTIALRLAAGHRISRSDELVGTKSFRQRMGSFFKRKVPGAEEEVKQSLKDMIKKYKRDKTKTLHTILATHETQCEDMARLMAKTLVKKDTLHMTAMPMTAIDTHGLIFVMTYMTNLRSLTLPQTNLDEFSARLLADFLATNSTITDVNLDWNDFRDEGLKPLSEMLHRNTTLQSLSLSGNAVTDEGIEALSTALEVNKTLRLVVLEQTQITNDGLLRLLASLISHSGLLRVRVSNRLTILNIGLCTALQNGTHLRDEDELVLKCASVTAKGSKNLTQLLAKPECRFKTLRLDQNEIGDAGIQPIADVLRQNQCRSLVELRIPKNKITDRGAAILAESLRSNNHLKMLVLSLNEITDDGAGAIADSLKENSSLQTLHLWSNKIRDAGAMRFGDALRLNTGLQDLMLSWNKISFAGAEGLAEALPHNSTLRSLNVRYNKIADRGRSQLLQSTHKGLDIKVDPQELS